MATTDRARHTRTGTFRQHRDVRSRFLSTSHDLLVYLPPGYRSRRSRRFPVLYMHDGQNLFDSTTAFGGQEWGVDETAQALIKAGAVEPLIIVGISNGGVHRIDEYTPTWDRGIRAGGKADLYGRMLVEEVKPFIDRRYRTLAGAPYTGLAGSSLGGLVSLYLGLRYPGVFRRLGVVSPSVSWGNGVLLREVWSLSAKLPLRIWLSTGTAEAPRVEEAARALRDALLAKGWRQNVNLRYTEVQGARHNEAAWAAIADPMLRYLFPPDPPQARSASGADAVARSRYASSD